MIQASGLEKSYGRQALFDGAGFTLGRGERLGLVGRNGSGKTTLFKMILGEEHIDAGSISVPSGYCVGRLKQHIRFTEATVLEEACTALPNSEDHRDLTYRAEAVLMGLGIGKAMSCQPPEELSGGYQVRLMLAKALLSEPDLLLLDEPTNYLDIVSLEWLREFLRSWPRELMLITHDRLFMDTVVTHAMAIHRRGFLKVEGNTAKLYDRIAAEEEHYEKARLNDERKRRDAERFISRFRAQATRASAVQSRIKALARHARLDKLPVDRDLDFSFNEAPFSGKRLMDAQGLRFGYPGGRMLINGLAFTVGMGARIGVVGRNGAGKTTLLKLLCGELSPVSGSIGFHPTTAMGYFGQSNVERLNPGRTVEEEILDASPELTRGRARNIAGAMLFEGDDALKKISVLSGGERSRVTLGRVLARRANLLLLDEPTNHLDMQSVDSLLAAIDAFSGAVIIVTHNETVLRSLAERLIVFDSPGGARVFEGGYADFIEKGGWGSHGLPSISGSVATSTRTRVAEQAPEKSSSSPITEKGPVTPARGPGFSDKKGGPAARKARAEVIQARSEALVPLAKRIEELEAGIAELEAQIRGHNEALVRASQEGDGQEIAAHSKALHEAAARLDGLYAGLARTSEEHDRLKDEFSRRLEALSG